MSEKDRLHAEPREYCYQVLTSSALTRSGLFGKNSSLFTLSRDSFFDTWNKMKAIIYPNDESVLEEFFQESIVVLVEKKTKSGVPDDLKYFFKVLWIKVKFKAPRIAKARGLKSTRIETLTELEQEADPEDILSQVDIYNILLHETSFKKDEQYALNPEQICALFNHHVYLRSMDEISDIYNEPRDTNLVRTDAFRARKRIRKFCENNKIYAIPGQFTQSQ